MPVAPPENTSPSSETAQPPVPAGAFHGFVVGIGASAGGLDALERLFNGLPNDTGAAFVVIQHLSPDYKSMMDSLLARYTAMPVRVAGHDMPLAANTVFLIPPAKSMRLLVDRLMLSPKAEHGLSLPIDIFFNSMAEQCADRGIAVVLSGTGSDGSRGVPAVNAAGGFVFVQEPSNAKFDGMPRSAVGTGLADVVASAEELAVALVTHLRTPRSPGLRLLAGGVSAALKQPLDGILELLLACSGIDFRDYKSTTVLRRIERRMQVHRLATLAAYLERLAATPDEQNVLRRELLIPVTRFFRDTEVWEQLAEHVIPALVQQTDVMEPIRVWVACCATGEEAYTIAILFAEAFQRLGVQRPVKIFATDVESQYLDHAAAGIYSDSIAAEVSGERLERCFVQHQGHWMVRPEIRQMVIFARHNLVADPPFTRMDLVTCRNALIYFLPAAQERALRRLQYALAPGGHMLLGPSESLGVLHRDFTETQGRQRIYRLLRRDRLALNLDGSARHRPTARPSYRRDLPHARTSTAGPLPAFKWVNQGQRQLLQAYTPPSMLIGPERELLHVYGSARDLLQIAEGEATLDVVKLLPRELAWAAALLLQSVSKEDTPLRAATVSLEREGVTRHLRMVARRVQPPEIEPAAEGEAPLPELPASQTLMTLISFEPLDAPPPPASSLAQLEDEQRLRVEALERELNLTQESLQATIEELETSNEELQATNEELMASNEELQSTNEELQSVNEELYTVNSEFQEKVDVLNSVNADLENIAKATAIPTVFLDEELRLQRFTPELSQLFKVREGDRGRSLEDFANNLDYPEIFTDLRRTLNDGIAIEREARSSDGRWWLVRIQPYGRTQGYTKAVVSFVNLTAVKDSERMQHILDSLPEHLAVLDTQGTIVRVNLAWRRFAALNGDPELRNASIGSNYLKVCRSAAEVDAEARAVYTGLSDVLAGRRERFTMQYPCMSQGRQLWFLMHAAPVFNLGGGAVVSHIDITEWVQSHPPGAAADGTSNTAPGAAA